MIVNQSRHTNNWWIEQGLNVCCVSEHRDGCGGDARRDGGGYSRAAAQQQDNNCSFVEETGLLPEPHKMTFSKQFVSMFLPAMSETDSMAVA